MTDHLAEARADLDRLEACNQGSWLASAVAHILDHLDAQQTEPEPDPLDESNHTDRIDRDGYRWVWCVGCDGLRIDGHEVHRSGYGWSTFWIDKVRGPLTFAPRPADTPTAAPQPDEAHGDAPDPARPAERHTAPDTYDVRRAWLGDEPIGSDADLDFCHWLGNICANAWGEGHRAGYADGVHPDGDHITPNPYRKGRA